MVGASVHKLWRRQTTPSAAPASGSAGRPGEGSLWPLYRGVRARCPVCNGADANAHIRPNGVWRSHSTISGRHSRAQSSR
eukprot:392693-Prymnesium_polylepis.1